MNGIPGRRRGAYYRDEDEGDERLAGMGMEEKRTYVYEMKRSRRQAAAGVGDPTYAQAKAARAGDVLDCYLNYAGMVVKEYTDGVRAVAFDVRIGGVRVAQYAVRLTSVPGTDDWQLKEYHLPTGFAPSVVAEKYAPMSKEYFLAMHRALTAYHDRLSQIGELKQSLPSHMNVWHSVNGERLEMNIRTNGDLDSSSDILLSLEYDTFENRPKRIDVSRMASAISNADEMEAIREQFKPLLLYKLKAGFQLIARDGNFDLHVPSEENTSNRKNNLIPNAKRQNNCDDVEEDLENSCERYLTYHPLGEEDEDDDDDVEDRRMPPKRSRIDPPRKALQPVPPNFGDSVRNASASSSKATAPSLGYYYFEPKNHKAKGRGKKNG